MAVREVLTYPHPLLKQVCAPAAAVDATILGVIEDLKDTLLSFPGCVGIAAPQIGYLHRIVMIDASRNRKPVANNGLLILINPVIDMEEGDEVGREGCLSIPDFTANVRRAKQIRLTATTPDNSQLVLTTSDFEARVIQHEADHLDGRLFLDRVSSLKTDIFRRKRYAHQ